MDSAFLHTRSLYEFFTGDPTGDEGAGRQPASWKLFGATRQRSPLYETWRETLHARLFHIRTNRPQPTSAKTGANLPQHIPAEVLNFAHDVLRLWDAFTNDAALADYRSLLNGRRDEAVNEARKIAERHKTSPQFT